MKSLILLELRKQSKSFLGLLAIIAISLTLITASISTFSGLSADEALMLMSVVLQAFGIPFFALLLGSNAGAALRSAERKAEEDIPVRPSKRIIAAYFASLTYLILLASVLFALTLPIKNSAILQEEFQIPIVMVILIPLHSAAFVFSYWLAQALLGGAVAALITIGPAYLLFASWLFNGNDFVLVSFIAVPGLMAACIHLSLMLWLGNRIEREKRTRLPMKVTIASVLLFALPLSFWGIFFVVAGLMCD